MDDVGHPLEELFGLVQQLQNVPGVQSLSGDNKQTLTSVNVANRRWSRLVTHPGPSAL